MTFLIGPIFYFASFLAIAWAVWKEWPAKQWPDAERQGWINVGIHVTIATDWRKRRLGK